MRDHFWSIGFLLCSLGFFGAAAWQYFGPENDPGLIVDEPEREISGCSVGQTMMISYSFHNRARHPIQIIGLAPC